MSESQRTPVSVLILTLDEETHLPACLDALSWCDDVIVVDSGSTDRTEEICRERGVRFVHHRFEGHGAQRNWAMDNVGVRNDWLLILDADERVPPQLASELARIAREDPPDVGAYRLRRRLHMWGHWLRHSSLYPTWFVRFVHRSRVRYENRGHGETQQIQGRLLDLEHDLIDENLKGIDEWFDRQNRYSSKDAEFEIENERLGLRVRDVLSNNPLVRRAALKRVGSRLPARGLIYFVYSYVWRRGFLDGRDGFVFCVMRALYQTQVQTKKYDLRKRDPS